MGDRDNGLAERLQAWQLRVIEPAPERRVLVGRPFVEDVDGPVFQQGHQVREALALAGGELER